ncbi:MAG: folylpolyglutamate synthase/dihydrofolate synthase family protein [Fuerstiella sp.]
MRPRFMDKQLPQQIADYSDAAQWIFDRINYERIRPRTSSGHFRLERIERLLTLIDSPQKRIPAAHIAGTKGKGSTSAMLDSILRKSGIRCGLFTSPHIHLFEERMRVNGRMPSQLELTDLVRELNNRLSASNSEFTAESLTYFEVATLLAWMYFDQQKAELVVLETGLGGRLDCTNVCQPLVTVITTIGLDHTHILGDTLEKIAAEKAGIIKPNVPVLTWALQPEVLRVISDKAKLLKCPLFVGETEIQLNRDPSSNSDLQQFSVKTPWRDHQNLSLPLMGEHQLRNAALAVAAADSLATLTSTNSDFPVDLSVITPTPIRAGIADVNWPLRFERIAGPPTVVLDAAHNPDAVKAFCDTFQNWPESQRNSVLIFASSADKDAAGMLVQLAPLFDQIVLTEFQTNPRAISANKLQRMLKRIASEDRHPDTVHIASGPESALSLAQKLSGSDGIICVTGSIFIAAEIRSLLVLEER